MRVGASSSPSTFPLIHSTKMHTPLHLGENTPCLAPLLSPLMETPPIPTGNQALVAAISRDNTPRLTEPLSPLPSHRPSPPLAFLAEVFSETRNSPQLSPNMVDNLSPPSPTNHHGWRRFHTTYTMRHRFRHRGHHYPTRHNHEPTV